MKLHTLIGPVFALATLTAVAHSTPVTYVESLTGSGTLDGKKFTNAAVTITLTGDNSVYVEDQLVSFNQVEISVAGVGSDTTSSSAVYTVYSEYTDINKAGWIMYFGPWPSPDPNVPLLEMENSAFANYNFSTSVDATGTITDAENTTKYATTDGTFELTSIESKTTGSIDITVGDVPVVTPEPATLSLLLTGLAGLGFARRRLTNRA